MAAVVLLGWAFTVSAETDPILPEGPNRAVVEETCTACHSAAIILQNRMSRQRWDETITWMQDKQGLGMLSPKIRIEILDYLEAVQGIDSPADTPAPKAKRIYDYDYPPNPL